MNSRVNTDFYFIYEKKFSDTIKKSNLIGEEINTL
jgi:hypothetical protein